MLIVEIVFEVHECKLLGVLRLEAEPMLHPHVFLEVLQRFIEIRGHPESFQAPGLGSDPRCGGVRHGIDDEENMRAPRLEPGGHGREQLDVAVSKNLRIAFQGIHGGIVSRSG